MKIIWILLVAGIISFAVINKQKFTKKKAKETINIVYKVVLIRYNNESLAKAIFVALNKERVKAGLKPFIADSVTTLYAKIRTRQMIQAGEASHEGYAETAEKLFVVGADQVGENVGYGYGTGAGVVRAWMKSPGHRKNILNPYHDTVGIYIQNDEVKRKYFCTIFVGEDEL